MSLIQIQHTEFTEITIPSARANFSKAVIEQDIIHALKSSGFLTGDRGPVESR
jgi:hypothetical protein